MDLWPPDWYGLFGIATFIVASIAVRGWRDLGAFALLIALLVFPLKWLGAAIGWAALAQDAVTWRVMEDGRWMLHGKPTVAFVAAAFLGALMLLAWKRVRAKQSNDA